MTRLCLAISVVGFLAAQSQPGAKWMFYNPYDGPPPAPAATGTPPPRLAPINWTGTPTGFQHVGIHYWFEDQGGKLYAEKHASTLTIPLTLHVRGNVAAFMSIWTQDRELTPLTGGYSGVQVAAGGEWVVSNLQFVSGDSPARILIVYGRSQTEQPGSPEHARRRLVELTTWKLRDGGFEVVRETDDATPNQLGTYVVSRQGMPIAAEIVLRSTSTSSSRR